MIRTRTPVRISFLGGGTDYPTYFRQHGGATLVTTIDKYTYVTLRPLTPYDTHHIRLCYDRIEQVHELDEIKHPAVRESLRFLDIHQPLEIHLASDLSVRAGLGSSSSFTVGLLKALHAYKGEVVMAEQVAREAVYVEQELIKERVGCQDQYACAYGGLQHLQFEQDGQIRVVPLTLSPAQSKALAQRVMLFDTGIRRTAHDVLDEQFKRTETNAIDEELASLAQLVDQGLRLLEYSSDLTEFGALLHEGWMLKRRLSHKVSNSLIDNYYARSRQAGASGGKLLGAGGGGFLLLFSEPDVQPAIRQALAELREINFRFVTTGSELMTYQPWVNYE